MSSIFYTKRLGCKRMPEKAVRPRTFSSEEAAKKYAEAHKIKDYTLVNLRESATKKKPKIKIVTKS